MLNKVWQQRFAANPMYSFLVLNLRIFLTPSPECNANLSHSSFVNGIIFNEDKSNEPHRTDKLAR
jgi:hypothetical protein